MFPGPGQYPTISAISPTGTQFYSKFQSSGCRKFGGESRSIKAREGVGIFMRL